MRRGAGDCAEPGISEISWECITFMGPFFGGGGRVLIKTRLKREEGFMDELHREGSSACNAHSMPDDRLVLYIFVCPLIWEEACALLDLQV